MSYFFLKKKNISYNLFRLYIILRILTNKRIQIMKNVTPLFLSLFFAFSFINNLNSQCPTSLNGFTVIGEFENHKYFLSNETATWQDAKVIAQNNGGYIVSINSQAENDYIQSNINEIVFTGFNDAIQNGVYELASGEPLTFNNFFGGNSLFKYYGNINFWNGQWEMDGKYTARKYIVEINCDINAGGITLDCPANFDIQLDFNETFATLNYEDIFNTNTTCVNGINDVAFFSDDLNFTDGARIPVGILLN